MSESKPRGGWFHKASPSSFEISDAHLQKTLGVKEMLALGIGTIVSTAIFTLPGIVAAKHAGPAVAISFVIAAVVSGLAAFAYAEFASALPFAGSAYSWANVVFGEVFGWIAGWALLAEYFIAVAFVASGWSANFKLFLASHQLALPPALAGSFAAGNGGVIDLSALFAVLIVTILLWRGTNTTARVENVLVIGKVLVILIFIGVGLTAIHPANYVPFIPAHKPGTDFGGWQGIFAGAAQIFLAYIGFDSIAANSAEAKDPKKTMPRGIIGSLVIATILFVTVALVLVGMFHYSKYANNAAPAAWALLNSGHEFTSNLLSVVALVGMFTAIIGMMLAGSRLLYAFGRDGLLPKFLGKVNDKGLPNNALLVLSVIAILIGSVFSFTELAGLISAGTLIAFIIVSLGVYALRPREGKDIPVPGFKMPLYPVLPALAALGSGFIFYQLDNQAKLYAFGWFVLGLIIYAAYGARHSKISR
ncbi:MULTISPECIES: APC family permease [Leuconostoc]|uniref:Amino acid transporter n=3 Tax=Bacteria TaxID=2 RepID=B1MXP6_LEUCK|nr:MULTISPECIES: amino acid permease [Leuconostoc]ACA82298.1 Amino acid transporter [Leuconostoc citreum KM20]KAF0261629.1 amino acid permease [Leuconostoc citreum]MBA5937304.1 amino acid permease [Leuconostoc citreum]MBE4725940.1 amino acid permease [Leuconostoc citreum]MBU7450572.1 amino acid permease [Leuconostoc citreum]